MQIIVCTRNIAIYLCCFWFNRYYFPAVHYFSRSLFFLVTVDNLCDFKIDFKKQTRKRLNSDSLRSSSRWSEF